MSNKTTRCNKKNKKGGTKRKRSNSSRSPSRSPSRSRTRTSRSPSLPPPLSPPSPQIDLNLMSVFDDFAISGPNTLKDEITNATHLNYPVYTYDDEPGMLSVGMQRSRAVLQHNKNSLIFTINEKILFLEEKLEQANSIALREQIESELAEKMRMLEYINTLSDTAIDNLRIEY